MLKKIMIGLFILLLSTAAMAATPDPMIMMRSMSDQMLSTLKKERANLKKDSELLYSLVNKIVVPHVDTAGMARSVLGRTVWQEATAAEQSAFIEAFKRVVVNTYSSALNAYSDETIKFFPIRGGYEGQQRIKVNSEVIRTDGPPVAVNYSLALFTAVWKVYDLNVEGISLLQSFRAQFSEQISQGKNITQITQELRQQKKGK
ncbi:MAG: ABC transporter substrate-binding protein [Pseudomonadota bacterium]